MARLEGQDVGDKLTIKPKPKEKEKILNLIQDGQFFCFKPVNYAFNTYVVG